jgi:hypothetical protein
MKSEKTAKELGEKFYGFHGKAVEAWAEEVAAFLGVELTPERPALPGWAEEDLALVVPCSSVEGSRTKWIPLNDNLTLGEDRSLARVNRAAFVEIHRRWLAAKRLLEVDPARIPSEQAVLALLRGEEG